MPKLGNLLAAAAAAVIGGCAPIPSTVSPPVAPLALTDCKVEGSEEVLRCGIYHAPEDRSIRGGRTLPLKVIVIPARHRSPDAVPILYFEGGPGVPATGEAGYLASSPRRDRRDIILIDQRGTGEGHRLGCPGPGTDEDIGSWLESVYQAPYPRLCRPQLEGRADLRLYTTPIAMQDYDEVRRELGYPSVNVMGGSYGSRAALIYLKMFGQHVRSALVSGLVPLEARLPLYHPRGAQQALDRLFAECAADPKCSAAFPDPRGDLGKVRARLRAEPATVELKHPETGAPLRGRLTEQRLLGAIRPMLYGLATQRLLPLALHRAADGNFDLFAQGAVYARGANQAIASGLALSVTCSEDVARITPADVARETKGTFLGAAFVEERLAACAEWPSGRLPADHFAPFTRQTPVLMVTGSHDPVTPKWMADAYARHFPNSRQLVVPAGHSYPPGDCLDRIAIQLFDGVAPRDLDTSCALALPVPEFALPG